MSAYSKEKVAKAIDAVPETSGKVLKLWAERGRAQGLDALVAACEQELLRRGEAEPGPELDAIHDGWAAKTEGLGLEETIFTAFGDIPPNQYEEAEAIALLHANPGIAVAEAEAAYSKGHFTLVAAHFVHIRKGFFRAHLPTKSQTKDRMIDLLIARDKRPEGMHYTLRPETLAAWTRLGVI